MSVASGPSQYEPRLMSASSGPSQYEPRPMSAFSGPSQYEPRPMSASSGPSQYEPRPMSAFSGPSQYKQRPIGTTGDMRLAGRPMRQVQEMRERILQMNNGMWAIRREAVVLEVDQCLLYNLV